MPQTNAHGVEVSEVKDGQNIRIISQLGFEETWVVVDNAKHNAVTKEVVGFWAWDRVGGFGWVPVDSVLEAGEMAVV